MDKNMTPAAGRTLGERILEAALNEHGGDLYIDHAGSAGARKLIAAIDHATADMKAALESLREIHSALDKSLGDTDATHIEDEEELRDEYPVQWAAQKLAALLSKLEGEK